MRSALEDLETTHGDRLIYVDIQSQTFDFNWDPSTPSRASLYNVQGVPHAQIDGYSPSVGGGTGTYNAINNLINARPATSPVSIEGMFVAGAASVDIQATFTLEDPVTLVSPFYSIMVCEASRQGVLRPQYYYKNLARHGLSRTITPADLDEVGEELTVNHSIPVGAGWDYENLVVVVTIQKGTGTYTRECYQSAELFLVPDYTFTFDPTISSVPSGSGPFEFVGTLTNTSDGADTITLSLDDDTGWGYEFKVEGEPGYHTTPSVLPLSSLDDLQVYVRGTTDSDVRIDAASMDAVSLATGRVSSIPLTVFNGSLSVLFVDDDGGRVTDQQVTPALDGNYLYHFWNIADDHGGAAPTVEDMTSYDAVLWYTGWEHTTPLATGEIARIKGLMDAGKGIVLCSQDYLAGSDTDFNNNYLGFSSFTQNLASPKISHLDGAAGDDITDGMSFDIVYGNSAYNRADDLTPNGIGEVILTDVAGGRVAVRADNGTARAVFSAFSWEAIVDDADPSNLATFLSKSIDYVYGVDPQDVDDSMPAVSSMIFSIGPNPFSVSKSAGSTLQLRISDRAANSPISVDMIDVQGRLVRQLVDGKLPAGIQSVEWDGLNSAGNPASAGVYYVLMNTIEGSASSRMVVIR